MTVRKFFGGLFMVFGGLVMLLAGGCGFFVMFSPGGGDPGMLMMVLIFSGVPMLFGAELFASGRWMCGSKAMKNPYLPDAEDDVPVAPQEDDTDLPSP